MCFQYVSPRFSFYSRRVQYYRFVLDLIDSSPPRVEFLLPLAALSLSLFQRACTYTVILVYFAQGAMVSSLIFHLSSIHVLFIQAMHSLSTCKFARSQALDFAMVRASRAISHDKISAT